MRRVRELRVRSPLHAILSLDISPATEATVAGEALKNYSLTKEPADCQCSFKCWREAMYVHDQVLAMRNPWTYEVDFRKKGTFAKIRTIVND